VKSQAPQAICELVPSNASTNLLVNRETPPFDNPDLRRGLARLSENVFLQPFCAALLAGVVGALAVRYQLGSSLGLVALCPCLILVPGPHVLNGGLDLIRSRIDLGASRSSSPS
jgi:Putative threonine/serine exporter